jgi:hypothetical protein
MTDQEKADRLAAALRENLKRRKAQARTMEEAEGSQGDDLTEAKAILGGPRLAGEWQKALEIIETSARAGNAEALERRALLQCVGLAAEPDWSAAVASLAEAAERGSQSAQGQLTVLSDGQTEGGWAAVRSRVDIVRRLQPPPPSAGRPLSMSPLVLAIQGFASARECEWLIQKAAPHLERAKVYNNPTGIDPGRTNQFALFDFAHSDVVVQMIRTRIANEIRAPLPCLEVPQVLRYGVGEEFTLHCDFLDPRQLAGEIARLGQRPATFLIYLNDDFEGGQTSFPALGIEHRGKAGDALIFGNLDARGNPDERSRHAGCPPTRGEKWVFSQWVRSKAPD